MHEGIDFSYLRSVSGGDKNFELTLIKSLQEEIEQKMDLVDTCVAAGDRDGLRLQAHSLKNLFAILGVETLRGRFLSLESEAESAPGEAIRLQAAQCGSEWSGIKAALAVVVADYEAELSA